MASIPFSHTTCAKENLASFLIFQPIRLAALEPLKQTAMKLVVIFAVAFVANGAPQAWCEPGTLRCALDGTAWEICHRGGRWTLEGNCPQNTICQLGMPGWVTCVATV